MADNKVTCGKITITYPSNCSYVCYCTPESGCHWAVTCGDWTTGGQGLISDAPDGHATVAGDLEACAKMLQKQWNRSVKVPKNLRGRRVRQRRLEGAPEDIARALGLELGSPKRKDQRPRRGAR
jgi:hypothetical protein